jgi:hypothetical protein
MGLAKLASIMIIQQGHMLYLVPTVLATIVLEERAEHANATKKLM